MWTRKLLKENAKIAFRRNYWTCVAVSAIAGLLGAATGGVSFDFDFSSLNSESEGMMFSSIPDYIYYVIGAATLIAVLLGMCFSILVANIVTIGCNRYFLENREHKTDVGVLFHGFKGGKYGSNVFIMFMKDLYVFLHLLLLIVPGIIKMYAYALVPYILAENPDLDQKRVLKLSSDMMDGHKGELFVLELSFIGWGILNAMTMGILGIFWVNPYIHATRAEFYTAVKSEALANRTAMPGELPGFRHIEETVEWTVEN